MADQPASTLVPSNPVPSNPAPAASVPAAPAAGVTRRRALSGTAALGLATPVLVACGGGSASDSAAGGTPTPSADGPLAATADVPVGSGVILEDQGVVLTQPTEGDIKAFSSICTHQGCPVTGIDESGISCTCHGSVFTLDTGEPESGPAAAPLEALEVSVQGDQISLA